MTTLHVLKVFIGPDGRGGNPLGVFLDGRAVPPDRRQAVAAELGYSETVFVDAIDGGGGAPSRPAGHQPPMAGAGPSATIRIFTPGTELPFAGHPTVGTGWLLAETGYPDCLLRPPAGDVPTWRTGELTWVRADPAWIHPMTFAELASPAEVEALSGPPAGETSYYPWAWIDEPAGILRSRYFAAEVGIAEDEATGAAAVAMGGRLGRPLTIRQGVGSELQVRPAAGGLVEVGGRVAVIETRPFG